MKKHTYKSGTSEWVAAYYLGIKNNNIRISGGAKEWVKQ